MLTLCTQALCDGEIVQLDWAQNQTCDGEIVKLDWARNPTCDGEIVKLDWAQNQNMWWWDSKARLSSKSKHLIVR